MMEVIETEAETGEEITVSPDCNKKPKKHSNIQYNKYLRTWEHKPLFRGWLKPVEGDSTRAFCTICNKVMMARVNLLGKHARTAQHRNNIPFDIPLTFVPSPEENSNEFEESIATAPDNSLIKVEIIDHQFGVNTPMTKVKGDSDNVTYIQTHDSERVHYNVQSDSYCINDVNFMRILSKENPRNVIPQLCRKFYELGWIYGRGGAMSIKFNDLIYITPSGIQLDMVQPDELFCQTLHNVDVELPNPEKRLRKSKCTPLLLMLHTKKNAGAVIHTHSPNSVLVTLLWPEREFCISRQEMIKGIKDTHLGRNLRYDEKLVIPIIENSQFEKDLGPDMEKALNKYKGTSAILIRRHGIYVWGDTWQAVKRMTECYEYLFNVAIEMKKLGLDPQKRQLNLIDDEEST